MYLRINKCDTSDKRTETFKGNDDVKEEEEEHEENSQIDLYTKRNLFSVKEKRMKA